MRPKALAAGMLSILCLFLSMGAQENNFPVLKGSYFGQKPPGMIPEIFAPGLISSTDLPEGCLCFSYDGNYLIFRRGFNEDTEVFISEQVNGTWTKPKLAPFFLKQYRFGDFTFAPDELKLLTDPS